MSKSLTWVKTLGIKVVKTSAESALGVIGTTAMLGQVDWKVVGGTVALSALVTVLLNLKDLKVPEE